MASSLMNFIWAITCVFTASTSIPLVSSSPSMCYPPSDNFLQGLHFRCPLSISSSSPVEMDGESLEYVLGLSSMNVYTAVLFYDSESPFSNGIRSKFDMLSSMFPQIGHIAVEESSAMPSLFSRYGIHSLPALFIVNQTAMMHYSGPKDLHSLAHFYMTTTGLDAVKFYAYDDTMNGHIVLQPWYQSSWKEMVAKEPYLVFAFLFLVLRAFLYISPKVLPHVTALWILWKRQLNFEMFGELSQVLSRVLHLMDVKRVWSKLKMCNTRNFQKGARSARVWASSLASVSLGETSSARSSSSIES